MNIFVIATNHQVIQLKKALEQFKIANDDAILLYINSDRKSLHRDILPSIPIMEFQSWTFRDLFTKASKYKGFISYLKILKNKYTSFVLFTSQYSTDYTLLVYSILKPKLFYLMDEGTASFSVVCKREKKQITNWRLILKSIVYKHLIVYPHQVCFYSQYNLLVKSPDSLLSYNFIKVPKEIITDDKRAIVLGTTLVEIGLVSNETYMNMLLNLNNFLQRKGIIMIEYYAHRKEKSIKLEQIQEYGWLVVNNEIPFELLYPNMDVYPKVLISFLSPILDTISKQYTSTPELYVISPIGKMINTRKKAVYKSIYEEFKGNPQLNIINLED